MQCDCLCCNIFLSGINTRGILNNKERVWWTCRMQTVVSLSALHWISRYPLQNSYHGNCSTETPAFDIESTNNDVGIWFRANRTASYLVHKTHYSNLFRGVSVLVWLSWWHHIPRDLWSSNIVHHLLKSNTWKLECIGRIFIKLKQR
jgi:hypothetical protein